MTRQEIKVLAEELYKLMRPALMKEMVKAAAEVEAEARDRIVRLEEAAKILEWSTATLRKRINEVPHTKDNKFLMFSERRLREFIKNGYRAV